MLMADPLVALIAKEITAAELKGTPLPHTHNNYYPEGRDYLLL